MEYLLKYYISAEDRGPVLAQHLNRHLDSIDSRLNDLEFVAKNKGVKQTVSRSQKMALLHELGVLDYLLGLGISQKKMAELLRMIIEASAANLEKDLSTRHNNDASFKNEEAYSFVANLFEEHELEEREEKARATLEKITAQKKK